jgi:hypothetical protein
VSGTAGGMGCEQGSRWTAGDASCGCSKSHSRARGRVCAGLRQAGLRQSKQCILPPLVSCTCITGSTVCELTLPQCTKSEAQT